MAFKFETFDYADVNNLHISDNDKELLVRLGKLADDSTHWLGRASENPLWHSNLMLIGTYHDQSFFVALGNDFTPECKAYLLEVGFSPEFAEIMWQLAEQHIYYVRFDAEGYDIEGARLFE